MDLTDLPLTADQRARLVDPVAAAIRAELVATQERCVKAQLATGLAGGTVHAYVAHDCALGDLRAALVAYLLLGVAPSTEPRTAPEGDDAFDALVHAARAEAFTSLRRRLAPGGARAQTEAA